MQENFTAKRVFNLFTYKCGCGSSLADLAFPNERPDHSRLTCLHYVAWPGAGAGAGAALPVCLPSLSSFPSLSSVCYGAKKFLINVSVKKKIKTYWVVRAYIVRKATQQETPSSLSCQSEADVGEFVRLKICKKKSSFGLLAFFFN